MRRLIILTIVCVAMGCTAPETKVAMTAVDTQNRQYETIHNDLVIRAYQSALDKSLAAMVATTQPADQKVAVLKMANEFTRIGWLDKEWAKTRYGPGGEVLRYIYGRQGWIDIFLKEAEEASDATSKSAPD